MQQRYYQTSMAGFNLHSVGFVGLLGSATPASYRADTLAYQTYADGRGLTNYDLAQIDAVHAALASASLPTGANANYHFSSPAFGVKLVSGRAIEVGCLYHNPLVEYAVGTGPLWTAGGWRGRDTLAYTNKSMKVDGLVQGTGQGTCAAVGDFGPPPASGGFAVIAELSTNFNNNRAFLLGIEAEIYMAVNLSAYNLVSEGSAYAAGPRYALGRVDAALAVNQQVQFSTARTVRSGRLYALANALAPPFAATTVFVGARGGTGNYLVNAQLNTLFLSNTFVTDAQAGALNAMAAYYNL
jgi:hypothetical protein